MKAVVAMSRNRVIGAKGKIPWHISEDLKFFKRTTLGHILVMGRKTYDSIGKPLPGRETWVVTRGPAIPGVRTISNTEEIRPLDDRELFVVGGQQIYAALLAQCDEVLLSLVDREVEGDTYFPPFEQDFAAPVVIEKFPEFEIRSYRRTGIPTPSA